MAARAMLKMMMLMRPRIRRMGKRTTRLKMNWTTTMKMMMRTRTMKTRKNAL
jgi:hypothetical protein